MGYVQLFFGLFKLTSEPCNLLLIGFFALLELDLEKGEFLHGFFNSLFVLVEHTIGGPVLWLESFIDVLEFDNFFMEILEFGFEIVSFSLDQFKFLFKNGGLVFFLFLTDKQSSYFVSINLML